MSARNAFKSESAGTDGNTGVSVFLDESFEPYVAAAAVVLEASDVQPLELQLQETFERVRRRHYMAGLPSFEEFRQRGFHASNDPLEVRNEFIGFLAEQTTFKSMIAYSDGSSGVELSKKRRLILVFDQLVRDVMRAYRSRSSITFCFESSGSIDKYVERVVELAAHSLGPKRPIVEVRFARKGQPLTLSIPDYVLHIFNSWLHEQVGETPTVSPAQHQSRSLKAVLGSISAARSLEYEQVMRRHLA